MGVEQAQAETATTGCSRAQIAEQTFQLPRIHAAPLVEPYAEHVAGSQAENPCRPGNAVMRVGVDQQHRRPAGSGHALFPASVQGHVAGRQKCGQVRERSTVRDQSGKLAGRPADFAAQTLDHRPLCGGRPRAHIVDRHGLVRHRPDRVEQTGQGDGSRHLVADITRVVQIMTLLQHHFDECRESLGQMIEVPR